MSLTEYNSGTTEELSFGVNTMIKLKNMTPTSDNTGTLLSRNEPHKMPFLWHVVFIFWSLILLLTPNGQFLGCAAIASSERYCVYICVLLSWLSNRVMTVAIVWDVTSFSLIDTTFSEEAAAFRIEEILIKSKSNIM
jgi:hypothetical protein